MAMPSIPGSIPATQPVPAVTPSPILAQHTEPSAAFAEIEPDAVRQALSFLRWREDDFDAIAPSLFMRPRVSRRATAPTFPTPVIG